MKPSIDEVKREHREKKSKNVHCWELWPVGVLNLLGFSCC
jgi:hypothetical protein